MKPRNPDRFLPSNDLVWVVYLNRQREVRGVIEGRATAEYLWDVKKVVPILKVDKGLAAEQDGAQVMKPIAGLDQLARAIEIAEVIGEDASTYAPDARSRALAAPFCLQRRRSPPSGSPCCLLARPEAPMYAAAPPTSGSPSCPRAPGASFPSRASRAAALPR